MLIKYKESETETFGIGSETKRDIHRLNLKFERTKFN